MKKILLLITITTTLILSGCAKTEEPEVPLNIMTNDGNLNVLWQDINKYSDIEATIGLQSKFEQYLFTQLTDELGRLTNEHLAKDQQLDLIVTNVDLAGDVQPTFGATAAEDVRVVTELYPPKISFEYTLSQNGKVIKSGTEKLDNMGFLFGIQPITNDPFPYERDLLTDWFKKSMKSDFTQ